jgi:hypothetical protein
MADQWVQNRIEQITAQEERRNIVRQHELYCDRMIRAEGAFLFNSLSMSVEGIVKAFLDAFPNDQGKRIEFTRIVPNGFKVRKPIFPALTLDVWLELDSHAVKFSTSRHASHDTVPHETTGILRIVALEGNLHLKNGERLITPTEAANMLMDCFLSPSNFN